MKSLKKDNSTSNLFLSGLIFFVSLWQYVGLGKANFRISQSIDQQIMLITAAKMHYFGYNSYDAAWNHHSPILFYITKISFLISDFKNSTYGLYVVYSIFLILLSVFLFIAIKELINNNLLSFICSLAFVFDLSSSTIGGKVIFDNRTIGMILQLLILINSIKFLTTKKYIFLYLSIIFSTFQIFNLESYAISVFFIYIYLLFKVLNKKKFLINTALFGFISALLFFGIMFLNFELFHFFDLNILFHLQSIGIGNKFVNISLLEILQNLFIGGDNPYINIILSSFMLFIIFISLVFSYFWKNFTVQNELLVIFLIGEFFHLLLTGPRFTSYSQIILIPMYILFILSLHQLIYKNIENKKIISLFLACILLIIFLPFQYGDVVYFRTSIFDGTIENINISHKNNITEPNLVLSWISIDKYNKVFFEANSLPSTRLWWWHQMKYIDEFYDKNYKMFDYELLEAVFLEDVILENPKFAVIDKSIMIPPIYFQDYINEHYQFSRLDGDLIYYQLNN